VDKLAVKWTRKALIKEFPQSDKNILGINSWATFDLL